MINKNVQFLGVFLWIIIGVVGRLIVHIPDVTPLTSLCLLAPTVFSKRQSFLIMLIILLLSDLCLHFLFHYSAFGSWTLFTYSAWFGVIFVGFLLAKKLTLFRALYFTFFASLAFWIWTNFGTWATTTLYSHDLHGLMNCYIAALPFLRNSIVGSCVWTGVLLIHRFFRHDKIHSHIPAF